MEKRKCPVAMHNAKRCKAPNGDVWEKGFYVGNINEGYVIPDDGIKLSESKHNSPSLNVNPILETTTKDKVDLPENKPLESLTDVSKSSIEALLEAAMAKQEEKFTNQLNSITADFQEQIRKANVAAIVGEKSEDENPEDFMETPRTYYTPCRGFMLAAYDNGSGRIIKAPLKPDGTRYRVYFDYDCTDIKQVGNASDYITLAAFKTWNKHIAAYVEASPYFNHSIWTSMDKASNITNKGMMAKIQTAMNMLSKIDDRELFNQAAVHGVNATAKDTKSEIKNKILEVMVARMVTNEELGRKEAIQDMSRDLFYKEPDEKD